MDELACYGHNEEEDNNLEDERFERIGKFKDKPKADQKALAKKIDDSKPKSN